MADSSMTQRQTHDTHTQTVTHTRDTPTHSVLFWLYKIQTAALALGWQALTINDYLYTCHFENKP